MARSQGVAPDLRKDLEEWKREMTKHQVRIFRHLSLVQVQDIGNTIGSRHR
jgi:hypothetical protein